MVCWIAGIFVLLALVGTVGGFYAAGYRAYVIHTGSMVPDLVPGDLVIDRPSAGQYQVGDVITFRHGPTDDLVTHRITQISSEGLHTKGDANNTADVWTIPKHYVEGVVKWTVPGLGYAVVFLKQPTGLASIALMLAALVLLWQLFFPDEQEDEIRDHAESESAHGPNHDTAPVPAEDAPDDNFGALITANAETHDCDDEDPARHGGREVVGASV